MNILVSMLSIVEAMRNLKFGNRSWFGTPFSSDEYYFKMDDNKIDYKSDKIDATFDFENDLKVALN